MSSKLLFLFLSNFVDTRLSFVFVLRFSKLGRMRKNCETDEILQSYGIVIEFQTGARPQFWTKLWMRPLFFPSNIISLIWMHFRRFLPSPFLLPQNNRMGGTYFTFFRRVILGRQSFCFSSRDSVTHPSLSCVADCVMLYYKRMSVGDIQHPPPFFHSHFILISDCPKKWSIFIPKVDTTAAPQKSFGGEVTDK